MDEELARLIAQANLFARTGEHMSVLFAVHLADVWIAAERSLADLVRANAGRIEGDVTLLHAAILRQQVREILRTSGYDTLAVAAVQTSADAFLANQIAAVVTREVSVPVLEALQQIASVDLLAQGDEAATAIWRAVTRHVLSTKPVSEILAELAATLDKSRAQVQTLFDTQTTILGRQIEASATQDLGEDQPYLYVGPIDAVIRDFCLERVGQVFSRKAIDDMDNGQIPNVYLSGGGFQCRHVWQAVESKELRAMMDTGEIVEPIGADVARVEKLQAEKRAARKKKAS